MNVIGKPDVYQKPLQQWFNENLVPIIQTPELGELDIKWHTAECQAEGGGEMIVIWRWNGEYWQSHSLDAHHTVGDLQDLEYEL